MVPLSAVLLLVFLIGAIVLFVAFSRWMRDESRTEARLHSPDTHTVRYVVPDGQDPAALMSALARVGFTAVVDSRRGEEIVIVACDESELATVRQVIERSGPVGSDRPTPSVRFLDDPGVSPA
jgi:hypothetical protein